MYETQAVIKVDFYFWTEQAQLKPVLPITLVFTVLSTIASIRSQ